MFISVQRCPYLLSTFWQSLWRVFLTVEDVNITFLTYFNLFGSFIFCLCFVEHLLVYSFKIPPDFDVIMIWVLWFTYVGSHTYLFTPTLSPVSILMSISVSVLILYGNYIQCTSLCLPSLIRGFYRGFSWYESHNYKKISKKDNLYSIRSPSENWFLLYHFQYYTRKIPT